MCPTLSNALFQAAAWLATAPTAPSPTGATSAPAPAPPPAPAAGGAAGAGLTPLLMGVASAGVFVLAAYATYRWARPSKLRLATAPRRHNDLTGLHFCLLLAVLLLVPAGVAKGLAHWLGSEDPRLPVLCGILPATLLVPAIVAGVQTALPALLPVGVSCALAGSLWAVDPRLTILSALLSQVLLLPVVLTGGKMAFPMGLRRGMGLSARHWFLDGLRAGVAYLAVFPVCLFLWWVGTLFPGHREHHLLEAFRWIGAGWKVLAAASAVVLAPLVEEIFFRGLLQSMLRNYFRSAWPAVLIASAVFAVTHGTPHWFPALFVLSVVLGYNYERTGRLLAPIVIHALFNGVTVLNVLVYGL